MEYRPNSNIPAPELAKTLVHSRAGRDVRVMGSVAYATPQDRGHVIVTGSHGGRSCGEYAARVAPLAAVANDAGIGKNRAGIAGMAALDSRGIIGLAVSHDSARIGEGPDTWENGRLSFVNATGRRFGLREGEPLSAALKALLSHPEVANWQPVDSDGDWTAGPMRRDVVLEQAGLRVVAMDSASLMEEADRGQVVIAAGNGGLESGALCARYGCALVALNDAGIGKEGAGVAGLKTLDAAGIPGLGISHRSAEISDGLDHWEHGIVSTVNRSAAAAGLQVGEPLRQAVQRLLAARRPAMSSTV